jgi:thymidine phosphorylase
MKNLFNIFTLGLTLGVVITLVICYQNHVLGSVINTNDLNKKLRVLQAASRKSLVEEVVQSAPRVYNSEYISK